MLYVVISKNPLPRPTSESFDTFLIHFFLGILMILGSTFKPKYLDKVLQSYVIYVINSFSSVQLLSHVWLFVTSWTAACQASLSIISSWSLLRLMSIESVMPSNHLILCCPLLLPPPIPPSIRVFSNESALCIRWPNIGVSASSSALPVNIQDWSPLGRTGWISLQLILVSLECNLCEDKNVWLFGALLHHQYLNSKA